MQEYAKKKKEKKTTKGGRVKAVILHGDDITKIPNFINFKNWSYFPFGLGPSMKLFILIWSAPHKTYLM